MIHIESFGYRHDIPDGDGILIDLRHRLHNPANDPALIQQTGLDPAVRAHVLNTSGARNTANDTADKAATLHNATCGDVRVLYGCQGGRHRSVVLADYTAVLLISRGYTVSVIHHHIERPVIRNS